MGRQILSQEGYEVATTANGDETLQYLAENEPDLVLVDTRMPGPSGFEICRRIKRHPKLNLVKVVLLAGPLEPFDPAHAEAAGSDGVLHKPLDAYSLIDTVKSLIGESRAKETSQDAEPVASLRVLDRSTSPAELSEAPEPGAHYSAESSGNLDPFGAAVQAALGDDQEEGLQEEAVRQAVNEVLTAAMPTLVDTLTQRVLERIKQL